MGHSAGCDVLTDFIHLNGCQDFKGLILSSPVDSPPTQDAIISGHSYNYQTPTLVLPAGLDNTPGNNYIEIVRKYVTQKSFYDYRPTGSDCLRSRRN